MILHTVAFALKHKKGSAEERDFLEAGMALGDLPMVENFQCYSQVSKKNDFDYGFSMEFESEEAYQAYNNHPVHIGFVSSRWNSEVERFLELDYIRYETT